MRLPDPGLDAALARIDRRFGCSPYRRLLRAAAAFNDGDAEAWQREMECGLVEAADGLGVPRAELTQFVLTATEEIRRSRRCDN